MLVALDFAEPVRPAIDGKRLFVRRTNSPYHNSRGHRLAESDRGTERGEGIR